MKRRVAVMLGAVLCAVGLSMGSTRAATVLLVDNDTVLDGCDAGADPFGTIQEAVDAAGPGARIRVCPGTYDETVTVAAGKYDLTVEGAKAGIDARWRSQTGESIVTSDSPEGVVRLLADNVVWDGFQVFDNIEGPGIYTSPDASGYVIRNTVFLDNGLGLYLNASGEALTKVRHNRFTANNEFEDPTAGNGIYSDQGARCVLIADNLFERHNGAGILFADSGKPQHCITVERNKSIDDRTFAAFYASSHVRLVANFVRGRRGDPTPGSAIFIGAGNKDVVVKRNHVESAGGNGIDVRDTGGDGRDGDPPRNVDVLKNKVRKAGQHGIDVAASGSGSTRCAATSRCATSWSASTPGHRPTTSSSPTTSPLATACSTARTSRWATARRGPTTPGAATWATATPPAASATPTATTSRSRSTRSGTSTSPSRSRATPGATDAGGDQGPGLRHRARPRRWWPVGRCPSPSRRQRPSGSMGWPPPTSGTTPASSVGTRPGSVCASSTGRASKPST